MKKSVAYLGVFLALAMILSYVEAILPFAIGIPGVKLGTCQPCYGADAVSDWLERGSLCIGASYCAYRNFIWKFGQHLLWTCRRIIKLCTYVYSDSDKPFSCSYGQYLWRNHT